MKRPLMQALAVVTALGFVAAACGGDDDTSEAATPATLPETVPATVPATTAAMSEFDLGGETVTVAVENAYLPFNYLDADTGEPDRLGLRDDRRDLQPAQLRARLPRPSPGSR